MTVEDFLNIKGTLNITDTFTVDITSLDAKDNIPGDPQQWDGGTNYSWTIATASEGIIGIDHLNYSITHFSGKTAPGSSWSFSLADSGKDLVLNYTIPEPSTLILLLLGVAGIRRRRHAAC